MSDSPMDSVIKLGAGLVLAMEAAEALETRDYHAKPIVEALKALKKDALILLEGYAKQVH